jgi:hypothetical protein
VSITKNKDKYSSITCIKNINYVKSTNTLNLVDGALRSPMMF